MSRNQKISSIYVLSVLHLMDGGVREMPVSIALLKNDDDPIISADQEQRELDQVGPSLTVMMRTSLIEWTRTMRYIRKM